ncbi:MAG: hypothetical protein ACR2MT_15310 [Aurantibacter sp.]
MKKHVYVFVWSVIFFTGCSSTKKLEINAPFTLGEAYGQEWFTEEIPKKTGYDLIIPIISLDEDDAVLQNLYHLGQMSDIKIELRETGMVAVAEFPSKDKSQETSGLNEEPFPFLLGLTEAVLSYLDNDKVRYIKINGIRQNPAIAYPTELARRDN